MAKKNALGRGLEALITIDDTETRGSSSINEINLSSITTNPDQPRREFDEESLNELAASIKQIGVIQPITLRKVDDDAYQIIAGERRYRASLMAGLETIPAYIKTVDDDEVMEMALVENIQREDLNSIEIALAYQNLIESLSLTQEQLSERVGKKRATIANYLRLLKLPAEVQMGIKNRKIDMGHARALVTIADPVKQLAIYNRTLKDELSVRKVESLVKAINESEENIETKRKTSTARSSSDYDLLKEHLSSYFDTEVQFTYNKKGKGKITIPFNSEEELAKIIVMFDKMSNR